MVCLIIVSTPGLFVRVKARFNQFGDKVGQGFIWPSWPGQGPGWSRQRPGPGA